LKRHGKKAHYEFIFAGRTGKPLVLANIVRRDILPTLKKAEIEWHRWHGFRRGLASNLYVLGVADKVIQRQARGTRNLQASGFQPCVLSMCEG
jgi:hypothetical protein